MNYIFLYEFTFKSLALFKFELNELYLFYMNLNINLLALSKLQFMPIYLSICILN